MHARRILGCLLLAAAGLLAFSQLHWLFTLPGDQTLPHFLDFRDYRVSSSIETFGFAVPAMVVGFFLLRSVADFWLWGALAVAGGGLWQFVIHELWLHYYELPHKYSHYAEAHPYFTGPLWWVLVRLAWHIIFPAAFILSVILVSRRAPNKSLQPTPGGAPVSNLHHSPGVAEL
jgi:hypothetical protein